MSALADELAEAFAALRANPDPAHPAWSVVDRAVRVFARGARGEWVEDVHQETLARVARFLPTLADGHPGACVNWLRAVWLSRRADHFRRAAKREREVPVEDVDLYPAAPQPTGGLDPTPLVDLYDEVLARVYKPLWREQSRAALLRAVHYLDSGELREALDRPEMSNDAISKWVERGRHHASDAVRRWLDSRGRGDRNERIASVLLQALEERRGAIGVSRVRARRRRPIARRQRAGASLDLIHVEHDGVAYRVPTTVATIDEGWMVSIRRQRIGHRAQALASIHVVFDPCSGRLRAWEPHRQPLPRPVLEELRAALAPHVEGRSAA